MSKKDKLLTWLHSNTRFKWKQWGADSVSAFTVKQGRNGPITIGKRSKGIWSASYGAIISEGNSKRRALAGLTSLAKCNYKQDALFLEGLKAAETRIARSWQVCGKASPAKLTHTLGEWLVCIGGTGAELTYGGALVAQNDVRELLQGVSGVPRSTELLLAWADGVIDRLVVRSHENSVCACGHPCSSHILPSIDSLIGVNVAVIDNTHKCSEAFCKCPSCSVCNNAGAMASFYRDARNNEY